MRVRARVYVKGEDRFIIPGHWCSDDDPEIGLGSASAVICESMMIGVVCGLEAREWMDLEANENGHGTIEHYQMEMVRPQFAHGGVTVLLISGPLFDQNHAEAVKAGRIVEKAA